jgi:hypothetical protein
MAASTVRSMAGPGDPHLYAHLVGQDRRQRRLTQARWSIKQHMIHRLTAHLRGRDRNAQVLFDAGLTDVLFQAARPQRRVQCEVFAFSAAGENSFVVHRVTSNR